MIKMLTGALGKTGRAALGVIGRIERSNTGNSVLHIGKPFSDGGWRKLEGGHVVLNPDEREELIGVLESHRGYARIKLGDVIGGPLAATVLAVEYHHGGDPAKAVGTVLAYSDHKREYWVWSVTPDGALENGTWKRHMQDAMNVYQVRSTDRLYSFFNTTPPVLTFGSVAERDKLKEGA